MPKSDPLLHFSDRLVLAAERRHKEEEAWFQQQVIRATRQPYGVLSEAYEVGAERAEVLVDHNEGNRRITDLRIIAYARDMETHQWPLNGEAIIVGSDGSLLTGQHRCLSIIKSQTAIVTMITWGIDPATRKSIDQGKPQTPRDIIGLERPTLAYVTETMAISRALKQVERGGTVDKALTGGMGGFMTRAEVVAGLSDELIDEIKRSIIGVPSGFARAHGPLSHLAFCHLCFSRASSVELADEFMKAFCDGYNILPGNPIGYMRKRLEKGRDKDRLTRHELTVLMFRTWNAWRRGEQPKTLPIIGDKLPRLER